MRLLATQLFTISTIVHAFDVDIDFFLIRYPQGQVALMCATAPQSALFSSGFI